MRTNLEPYCFIDMRNGMRRGKMGALLMTRRWRRWRWLLMLRMLLMLLLHLHHSGRGMMICHVAQLSLALPPRIQAETACPSRVEELIYSCRFFV